MSRKKRQRDGNLNMQAPPSKKVKNDSRTTFPAVSIFANGTRTDTSINQNAPGFKVLRIDDADLDEKSGYESLDLLEQTLLEPSNVQTPSSLPPPKTVVSAKTGTQSSHLARDLPALPFIQDLTIAEAPFTHQGVLKDVAISDRGTSNLNYERLEFLGDAYLELIATRVILPRFPFFDPGKLSQTRQLLVCNETLADFSQRYDFDKRAHLPEEIRRKQNSYEKGWIKVMGDIFEAYVAALIISDPENGFATAENWLTELWEPLLLTQVNPEVADAKAKQILATKIMTKGTKIDYRDAGPPEKSKTIKGQSIFRVRVCYTGLGYMDLCLGGGRGSNKAEAGYAAAAKALQNPVTTEIMAKKKEFDLKSKAEREQ